MFLSHLVITEVIDTHLVHVNIDRKKSISVFENEIKSCWFPTICLVAAWTALSEDYFAFGIWPQNKDHLCYTKYDHCSQ